MTRIRRWKNVCGGGVTDAGQGLDSAQERDRVAQEARQTRTTFGSRKERFSTLVRARSPRKTVCEPGNIPRKDRTFPAGEKTRNREHISLPTFKKNRGLSRRNTSSTMTKRR